MNKATKKSNVTMVMRADIWNDAALSFGDRCMISLMRTKAYSSGTYMISLSGTAKLLLTNRKQVIRIKQRLLKHGYIAHVAGDQKNLHVRMESEWYAGHADVLFTHTAVGIIPTSYAEPDTRSKQLQNDSPEEADTEVVTNCDQGGNKMSPPSKRMILKKIVKEDNKTETVGKTDPDLIQNIITVCDADEPLSTKLYREQPALRHALCTLSKDLIADFCQKYKGWAVNKRAVNITTVTTGRVFPADVDRILDIVLEEVKDEDAYETYKAVLCGMLEDQKVAGKILKYCSMSKDGSKSDTIVPLRLKALLKIKNNEETEDGIFIRESIKLINDYGAGIEPEPAATPESLELAAVYARFDEGCKQLRNDPRFAAVVNTGDPADDPRYAAIYELFKRLGLNINYDLWTTNPDKLPLHTGTPEPGFEGTSQDYIDIALRKLQEYVTEVTRNGRMKKAYEAPTCTEIKLEDMTVAQANMVQLVRYENWQQTQAA